MNIPPRILPLLKSLAISARGIYLLPSKSRDVTTGRSAAVASRFSRLRTSCGHDTRYVFQSIGMAVEALGTEEFPEFKILLQSLDAER